MAPDQKKARREGESIVLIDESGFMLQPVVRRSRQASHAEAAQDLLSLNVGPLPPLEELQEEITDAFAAED